MANIFQQYLRPPKSIADYTAEYDAADNNKLALAAKRMGLEQAQRGMADEQAARAAFTASGGDSAKYRNALIQIGNYKGVQALDAQRQAAEKGQSDLDTAAVTRRKMEQEVVGKALDNAKPFAAQIQDAAGAQAYVKGLYNDPVLGKYAAAMMPLDQALQQIPQDPQQLARWKAGHMQIDGAKLIELTAPKMQTVNAGNAHVTQGIDQFTGQVIPGTERSTPILQSADNAASQAQSDVNSRRSASTAAADRAQREGASARSDKTTRDTAAAIIGKPLTEGQAKAVLFGSRMEASNKIIDELEKNGTTTSIPGSRAGFGVGAVVSALSSANQQKLDQAKRDFINATLRRESGAVISDPEFANGEMQYFPQVGDSKEVIAQKRENRQIAMRGVQAEVPANHKDLLRQVQGVAPDAVPRGGGFKYLGTE